MAPLSDAHARLAASREDIERWLARDQASHPASAAPPSATGQAEPPRSLASLLIGAVARSWLGRPVPAGGALQVGLAVAQAAVQPLARSHPWALLAVGVAAGGLLFLVRPWRWAPRAAVLAGVVPPLLTLAASRYLKAAHPTTESGRADAEPTVTP